MESLSPLQDFLNSSPSNASAVPLADDSAAVTTSCTMFSVSTMPTIKVEEPSTTITPDLLSLSDSPSPPPESFKAESSSSKQVKKRKSWGQVLPEPTTNLPPRKRAKTADEKEQRRIERVKRNRLAAHNSRERKREEMEKLQLENDALVDQMNTMQQQIQQLQDEIRQFRAGKTPSVSSFSFSSAATAAVPADPATTLTTPELGNLESPITNPDDFSQPPTPAAEEQRFVEPTQQSAALLCDLQCRSTRPASRSPSSLPSQQQPLPPASSSAMLSTFLTFWLNLQLYLTNCSTLSSIWSRTSIPQTLLAALSLPPTAMPAINSSPTLRALFTLTSYSTMLARLPTSSASSPTLAHLHLVATGQASALRMQISRRCSRSRRSVSRRLRGDADALDPGEIGARNSLRDRDARRRMRSEARRNKREVRSTCQHVCEADTRTARRRALQRYLLEQKILGRGVRR